LRRSDGIDPTYCLQDSYFGACNAA